MILRYTFRRGVTRQVSALGEKGLWTEALRETPIVEEGDSPVEIRRALASGILACTS